MSFVVIFNLILTVLTAVTGAVWLVDRLWLRKRRGGAARPGTAVEFCTGLFPVIFAVFVLRSFVIEPFRIPSGSMIPTLHVGDFILVNKYAYGLRCPVGSCKLVDIGEPQRGDVVVFHYPARTKDDPNYGADFIKRVIGTPGDRVSYTDKVLSVNGQRVELTPDGLYAEGGIIQRLRENFGGVVHDILIDPQRRGDRYSCGFVEPGPDRFDFTVPDGQYFMMGDNRDGSNDSRCWGTVPEANLKGRAILIWMSWGEHLHPDFSRFGTVIH